MWGVRPRYSLGSCSLSRRAVFRSACAFCRSISACSLATACRSRSSRCSTRPRRSCSSSLPPPGSAIRSRSSAAISRSSRRRLRRLNSSVSSARRLVVAPPLRDQLLALVDEALALPDQALVFQRILIRLRRVVWGAFPVYAPAPTHPKGPNTGHRHRPPRQHVSSAALGGPSREWRAGREQTRSTPPNARERWRPSPSDRGPHRASRPQSALSAREATSPDVQMLYERLLATRQREP
jgi:hypothetical protein